MNCPKNKAIVKETQIIHYPFKFICKIGSGSYGYVYKCLNLETNNIVALKKCIVREGEEQEGI
jgi:hypothetical protein